MSSARYLAVVSGLAIVGMFSLMLHVKGPSQASLLDETVEQKTNSSVYARLDELRSAGLVGFETLPEITGPGGEVPGRITFRVDESNFSSRIWLPSGPGKAGSSPILNLRVEDPDEPLAKGNVYEVEFSRKAHRSVGENALDADFARTYLASTHALLDQLIEASNKEREALKK